MGSPEDLALKKNELTKPEVSGLIIELFKKGMNDYKRGDIDSAVNVFRTIIEENSNIPEPLVNLGNALFKQEKIDEAVDCWQKALKLDKNQIICHINLGNAYYLKENLNEAIYNWHIAIVMAPDHQTALLNLSAAYEKLKDKLNSFKYLNQYLTYSTNKTSLEYRRVFDKVNDSKKIALHNFKVAVLFQNKKDYKNSAYAYVKSIKAFPLEKAFLNLGSILYLCGKMDSAIKQWNQALKINPLNGTLYCNMGIAYDRLNKPDYAFCMYTKYLNLADNKASYEIEERINTVSKYLKAHQEIPKRHLDTAEDLYKQRKFFEALQEYENYVILNPSQEQSFSGRIGELKSFADSVTTAAQQAYEAGNKCFDRNYFQGAFQAYKRSLLLQPESEYSKEIYIKLKKCANFIGKV